MLLAVAGLIFAQHRISLEFRQAHNVPISIIYGALYVTFGVIIGFSAYLVLNKSVKSRFFCNFLQDSMTLIAS